MSESQPQSSLERKRDLAKKVTALRFHKLAAYRPRPKQIEFHTMGATFKERGCLSGNRTGKTMMTSAEDAIHLTGRYPSWWKGKRFTHPIVLWAGSTSSEQTRDGVMKALLGSPSNRGTGMIPQMDIMDVRLGKAVADFVDYVLVRHQSGGISRCQFKSFDQKREKWQVEGVHVVHLDEEPSEGIYKEALTRTNETSGIVYLSATPLLGMTDVMNHFYPEPDSPNRGLIQMTIRDSGNFTAKQIETIESQYEDYELEARTLGIPMLGSGRVYPIAEGVIKIPGFKIPSHWGEIGAIDFGFDHPTGAVRVAYDPDSDKMFVTETYRVAGKTPSEHAMTLRHWEGLLWAWPHDGLQRKDGAEAIADQYRNEGLKMMSDHATFPTGGYGLEAGIMEMLDRMRTGRLFVFDHLSEWFEEFRLYHRKDGKIVDRKDDLLDPTRVAMMCLRFCKPKGFRLGLDVPTHVGVGYDPLAPVDPRPDAWDPLR